MSHEKKKNTIPMAWQSAEREIRGEIMQTDVYIKVFSETRSLSQMEEDIDRSFEMFHGFESRLSRFREGNDLSVLNASSVCQVSEELFEILVHSKQYFEETNGIFDPTIASVLAHEGYAVSFGSSDFGKPQADGMLYQGTFADVFLDTTRRSVRKPLECHIDLGGIGKGYIVDRVADMLASYYTDCIVDAGGDMYVSGQDRDTTFPYFAIAIENAREISDNVGLLTLQNCAVATSGVNRRKWHTDDGEKGHLIDTKRKTSIANDILSVTVLAECTERADVVAKTLCILGSKQAKIWAQERCIPALFVLKDGTIESNIFIQPYLWKEST